jgi:hypothetical protein
VGRDLNGSFTPGLQNGKAGGEQSRRLTRRRIESMRYLIFLPLIVVILEVKVKIIRCRLVFRKPTIRKAR